MALPDHLRGRTYTRPRLGLPQQLAVRQHPEHLTRPPEGRFLHRWQEIWLPARPVAAAPPQPLRRIGFLPSTSGWYSRRTRQPRTRHRTATTPPWTPPTRARSEPRAPRQPPLRRR